MQIHLNMDLDIDSRSPGAACAKSGVISIRVHLCADAMSCNTVMIGRENRGVSGPMRESCMGLFCFGALVVCGSEFIHNL